MTFFPCMTLYRYVGPGHYNIISFISSYGTYITDFVSISTFRGDDVWLGNWMLFFFGWFIGFGALVSLFVARIFNGRVICEIFLVVVVVAHIVIISCFDIIGGTRI